METEVVDVEEWDVVVVLVTGVGISKARTGVVLSLKELDHMVVECMVDLTIWVVHMVVVVVVCTKTMVVVHMVVDMISLLVDIKPLIPMELPGVEQEGPVRKDTDHIKNGEF